MAFYWWWTARRPWDKSQIILKRSKTCIVWICVKCDFNKCSPFTSAAAAAAARGNENNTYCRWKATSLFFVAASSDSSDLSQPLATNQDTQRHVGRQGNDRCGALVSARPSSSVRGELEVHWQGHKVSGRGGGQGWVDGHRTRRSVSRQSPRVWDVTPQRHRCTLPFITSFSFFINLTRLVSFHSLKTQIPHTLELFAVKATVMR